MVLNEIETKQINKKLTLLGTAGDEYKSENNKETNHICHGVRMQYKIMTVEFLDME